MLCRFSLICAPARYAIIGGDYFRLRCVDRTTETKNAIGEEKLHGYKSNYSFLFFTWILRSNELRKGKRVKQLLKHMACVSFLFNGDSIVEFEHSASVHVLIVKVTKEKLKGIETGF